MISLYTVAQNKYLELGTTVFPMPVFCSKARADAWLHKLRFQLISIRLFKKTIQLLPSIFHKKFGFTTTGVERARLQALGQLEGTTSMGRGETNGSWM